MKLLTTAVSRLCLTITMCIISIVPINAQNSCASDIVFEHLMQNSAYNLHRNILENKIETAKQNGVSQRNGTAFIPVVVHILHNGEALGEGTNLSEENIIEGINRVNAIWNDESGQGANMNVRFCLASTDPDGNATNGITRTNASNVSGYNSNGVLLTYEENSNEVELKNLSNWPHDQYYNIWVVHKFNAGWGGYAYFPAPVNYDIDGTLVVPNAFLNNHSLLAHELGHGFNLFHTFHGANGGDCPSNDNCSSEGDRVCDTPPHRQNDCSASGCNGSNFESTFNNYMSYCSGLSLFTQGQKERVDATLANSSRSDLLNSSACSSRCSTIPSASFTHQSNGLTVAFSNQSENTKNIVWYFGDGTTAVGFNEISHTYANPGVYEVKIKVEDDCGAVDYNTQMVDASVLSETSFIDIQEMSLSPNPNNGNFGVYIKGKAGIATADLALFDAVGKNIDHRQTTYNGSLEEQFAYSDLAPGMYFVQIQMNGSVVETKPFIVK